MIDRHDVYQLAHRAAVLYLASASTTVDLVFARERGRTWAEGEAVVGLLGTFLAVVKAQVDAKLRSSNRS